MRKNFLINLKILKNVLIILLAIILAASACEAKNKEKTVPVNQYNALVDEYNQCRDLLIESNENLVEANRMLDDLGKKKCPSQIKEKALIGVIVGISCLLIGVGAGVAIVVEIGN